jgi:hypothetical protein
MKSLVYLDKINLVVQKQQKEEEQKKKNNLRHWKITLNPEFENFTSSLDEILTHQMK